MVKEKIKLLIFCYGGDYGGVDSFLENLIPDLYNDCELFVCSFKEPKFLLNLNKEIMIESNIISINPATLLFEYLKLIRFVMSKKIQVLLSNEFTTNIFCAPLKLFIPSLVHVSVIHCDYKSINLNKYLVMLITLLKGMVIRFIDKLVCVSKFVADVLMSEGINKDKVCIIPNGVKEYFSKPVKYQDKKNINNIAFVGRISLEKGIDIFMKIAQEMKSESIVFNVYSGTTSKEMIEKYVNSKSCAIFHGYVNKPIMTRDIDVLVVPSRMEGLPMSILEAFMMKIPVVASFVGGIPELIEHKKTGLICKSGEVEEYKDLISLLIMDPDLRNEICERAYIKFCEAYTANLMAKRYLNLIKDLLEGSTNKK